MAVTVFACHLFSKSPPQNLPSADFAKFMSSNFTEFFNRLNNVGTNDLNKVESRKGGNIMGMVFTF